MSVQVASTPVPQSKLQGSGTKSSKKRKLETPEKQRSSSKKRKQDIEDEEVETEVARKDVEWEKSEERKSRNKKHTGERSVAVSLTNGGTLEADDDTHADAGVVGSQEPEASRDNQKEKKRNKKRSKTTDSAAATLSNERITEDEAELPDLAHHGAEQSPELSKTKEKSKKRKRMTKDTDDAALLLPNGMVNGEDHDPSKAPALNGTAPPDATDSTRPSETAQETNTEHPFGMDFLDGTEPSCFYSTRLSLYVSIPAVSLSTARDSILSMHLAPLLLTYFPPAKGIVLAFSDPVLSAKPDFGTNLPLRAPTDHTIPEIIPEEVMSRAADDFGACWVWLTVTFLVFRPKIGDKLHGWTNVTSKGFVGLLSYNYFQTAVGQTRIPKEWTWNGPTREQRKKKSKRGRLRDESGISNTHSSGTMEDGEWQDEPAMESSLSAGAGSFSDQAGAKVPDVFEFQVVDTEMVPEKDKWALHIDGTLLDEEAERKVLEEDRIKFERIQNRGRSATPGPDAAMSGGLAVSRAGSAAAESQA